MAGISACRIIVSTTFLVFSAGSATSVFAQTPLKFPPFTEGDQSRTGSQNNVQGPFWNSANMPQAPAGRSQSAQQPPQQLPRQNQPGSFKSQQPDRSQGNSGNRPAQGQQQMQPRRNQAGNFNFQPRNRAFDNSRNMAPPGQQQMQPRGQSPRQNQAGNFNFQPRNSGNGYRGQRPPMPPQQYGYRPYPSPQFQGGPRWGNGRNNSGPFGKMPFSGGPFGNNAPWGGGPSSWFGDGPKEGMANAWEDMINAPSRMGDMPGGWSFPEVGMPNPVDVGDQFGVAGEEFATEMPEFARELPDMFNFRP